MFGETSCQVIRLALAYATIAALFVFEWLKPGSAKSFEVVVPATITAYHLGDAAIRYMNNRTDTNG